MKFKLSVYTSFLSKIIYYLLAILLGFLIGKILFQYKVIGKERIKNIKGKGIFVINHCHYLDCLLVALASFPKYIKFAAMDRHFKNFILKIILTALGAFPIRIDGREDLLSFKIIKKTLEKNGFIGFFPEYHLLYMNKRPGTFRIGAFLYAVFFQANIIPVAVKINNIYTKKGKKIPIFKKAYIEFLPPRKIQEDFIKESGLTGKERSIYEIKKNANKKFISCISDKAENIRKEIENSLTKTG